MNRCIIGIMAFSVVCIYHACFGGVLQKWSVETSEISSQDIEMYHGETVVLQCQMHSYGKVIGGCSTASFLWQTNGMGDVWWVTNAVSKGQGVFEAQWTPAMDVGNEHYRFFLKVSDSKGNSYRANGSIAMLDGPGAVPNELPQPIRILDFGNLEIRNATNAPFAMKGEGQDRLPYATNAIPADVINGFVQSQRRLGEYVWEVSTEGEDFDAATNRLERIYPVVGGGCTGVCNPRYHGRNLDWYFDRIASIVVRSPAKDGKYGVLGICDGAVTDEVLASGVWTNAYLSLPFTLSDGINDRGVVIQQNVIPKDGANPWRTRRSGSIIAFAIIRWALDCSATAYDAATNINNRVFIPAGFPFDLHFQVSDRTSSYIVEDGVVYANTPTRPTDVMTNFRIGGDVTFTTNGLVNWESVEPYGNGLERYDWVRTNGLGRSSADGMAVTMRGVWYSQAYLTNTVPYWYTEHCTAEEPEFTVMNAKTNHFTVAWTNDVAKWVRDYEEDHNRGGVHYRSGKTWQTVHTSIYDKENLSLRLYTQEDEGSAKEFYLENDCPRAWATTNQLGLVVEGLTNYVNEKVSSIDGKVSSVNGNTGDVVVATFRGNFAGYSDLTQEVEAVVNDNALVLDASDYEVVKYFVPTNYVKHTTPNNSEFISIAGVDGKLIAVDWEGYANISTDGGSNWISLTASDINPEAQEYDYITQATYFAGWYYVFIMNEDGEAGDWWQSITGSIWIKTYFFTPAPVFNDGMTFCVGGDDFRTFIITCIGGYCITYDGGYTWTKESRSIGTTCYAGDKFFDLSNRKYSSDGKNWSNITITGAEYAPKLQGIAYGNGVYVGVSLTDRKSGNYWQFHTIYSGDGINWSVTADGLNKANYSGMVGVVWTGKHFVAFPKSLLGSGTPWCYASEDGKKWVWRNVNLPSGAENEYWIDGQMYVTSFKSRQTDDPYYTAVNIIREHPVEGNWIFGYGDDGVWNPLYGVGVGGSVITNVLDWVRDNYVEKGGTNSLASTNWVNDSIYMATSSLSAVAISGNYSDLTNVPVNLPNPKALKFMFATNVVEHDGSAELSMVITNGLQMSTLEDASYLGVNWLEINCAIATNAAVDAAKHYTENENGQYRSDGATDIGVQIPLFRVEWEYAEGNTNYIWTLTNSVSYEFDARVPGLLKYYKSSDDQVVSLVMSNRTMTLNVGVWPEYKITNCCDILELPDVTKFGYHLGRPINVKRIGYADGWTNSPISVKDYRRGVVDRLDVMPEDIKEWVTNQCYVTKVVTNELASTNWVKRFVTIDSTNTMATTEWVTNQCYVTKVVTNELASTNWVLDTTSDMFLPLTVTNLLVMKKTSSSGSQEYIDIGGKGDFIHLHDVQDLIIGGGIEAGVNAVVGGESLKKVILDLAMQQMLLGGSLVCTNQGSVSGRVNMVVTDVNHERVKVVKDERAELNGKVVFVNGLTDGELYLDYDVGFEPIGTTNSVAIPSGYTSVMRLEQVDGRSFIVTVERVASGD